MTDTTLPPNLQPVDLTNCDREPIHLLGAVQSFGFLIGISTDWIVTTVSENAATHLGIKIADITGQPLDKVILSSAVHTIRGHMQTASFTQTVARAFGVNLLPNGLRCDLAIHAFNDTIIIECEPCLPQNDISASEVMRGMVARLNQTEDIRSFFRFSAREIRGLTGFDRVMVYRFAHDGSGEVIAESVRSGLGTFLGLHYPASDIPQQARILYARNWLRIIPDIEAKNYRLIPQTDPSGEPFDLSLSVLRSVSPIHIEYLRNMGVRASMSISILRDGKLWGLFACHHYAPHHVPFERRTAAELFGQIFSLLLENRERDVESHYETAARSLHDKLIASMAADTAGPQAIAPHIEEIADLVSCDGIAVCVDGHIRTSGICPDRDGLVGLIAHLNSLDLSDILASHEIGTLNPDAAEFIDRAAGILVVPLSRPARNYVLFFRQEVSREVTWAGNPEKPVTVGPLGDRLTPRKSFEIWRDTVRGQSRPWTKADLRIAEGLRVSLLEVILRLTSVTEQERKRAQERQELLIAELNHRVRNILSLIRSIVSRSKETTDSVAQFTDIVGGRIQSLARAHDLITANTWGPASFHAMVAAEAAAYIGDQNNRIRLAGADVLLDPEAFTTVALVMHELMTNSAKYGALSVQAGHVELETALDRIGQLAIIWKEVGGPAVREPTRKGFGTTIIERSIPFDLNGSATIDYARRGLRASFVIPAPYVQTVMQPEKAQPERPRATTVRQTAVPQKVLLVEDNLIIALDTEDTLRSLGVAEVLTAASVQTALQILTGERPDFAILDVSLGSEKSFPIAQALTERRVPFAFATGYGERIAFPEPFREAPILLKPYTEAAIRAVLCGGQPE